MTKITSTIQQILKRLQNGQKWLENQWKFWIAGDERAVSDERFSEVMAEWDKLEKAFRCTGYSGCLWGKDRRCPDYSPVICDGCVELGRKGKLYHGRSSGILLDNGCTAFSINAGSCRRSQRRRSALPAAE